MSPRIANRYVCIYLSRKVLTAHTRTKTKSKTMMTRTLVTKRLVDKCVTSTRTASRTVRLTTTLLPSSIAVALQRAVVCYTKLFKFNNRLDRQDCSDYGVHTALPWVYNLAPRRLSHTMTVIS